MNTDEIEFEILKEEIIELLGYDNIKYFDKIEASSSDKVFQKMLISTLEILKFIINHSKPRFQFMIHIDDFLNQLVFEFWYDRFIESAQYTNIYKMAPPQEEPYEDNTLYRHSRNKYKQIIDSKNQQKQKLDENGYNNVDPLKYFPVEYNKKDTISKYEFPEYARLQFGLLILNTHNKKDNILWKIANGKLGNKNYSNTCMYEDLKFFDYIYGEIEKLPTAFERCVQYYQLEITYRYETFYKICMNLKKEKRMINNDDIAYAHSFLKNKTKEVIVQNRFICGLDNYHKKYKQFNDKSNGGFDSIDIAISISNHNFIRKYILNGMKEMIIIPDDYDILKSSVAEVFFNDFLGQGQHIHKNKNLKDEIKLSDLKKIYEQNE